MFSQHLPLRFPSDFSFQKEKKLNFIKNISGFFEFDRKKKKTEKGAPMVTVLKEIICLGVKRAKRVKNCVENLRKTP